MGLTLVSTYSFSDASLQRIGAAGADIELLQFPKANVADVPAEALARADVLYAYTDLPVREAAANLKWVQVNWAGVDRIVHAPLFKGGDVVLTTGAGIHAVNMSEYTLMMMLALAHRLPRAFAMVQESRWPDDGPRRFMPSELRGATLGLIGYGSIGKEIARLAQAFGMRVMALRRSAGAHVRGSADEQGVAFVTRDQLGHMLAQSDFVVLAVPSTAETRGMIGVNELAHMKPSTFLINIGRGDAVDEDALVDALQNQRIGGAALDVFQQEPLPATSPLWRLAAEGRVIMTPHVAGQTPNYEARAAELFAENVRRYVAGEPLINRVDFARGY